MDSEQAEINKQIEEILQELQDFLLKNKLQRMIICTPYSAAAITSENEVVTRFFIDVMFVPGYNLTVH